MDVELDVSIPPPADADLSTDGSQDMIDVFGGARMLAPLAPWPASCSVSEFSLSDLIHQGVYQIGEVYARS